jgi:hypothetical protein
MNEDKIMRKSENRLHVMNIKVREKMNGVRPIIVKSNTISCNLNENQVSNEIHTKT